MTANDTIDRIETRSIMSRGILNAVAGPLKSGLAFSYGLFSMVLYGLISVYAGYFFTPLSEKEVLELQLGTFDSSLCTSHRQGKDYVQNDAEKQE